MLTFQRRTKQTAEISLIPLINVIFLLVIFFLLTGTVGKQDYAASIEAPGAKSGGEIAPAPLTIILDDEGAVMVDTIPVTMKSLENDLSVLLQARKYQGQPLIIEADKKAPALSLVKIMDIAGNAGVAEVSVITRK